MTINNKQMYYYYLPFEVIKICYYYNTVYRLIYFAIFITLNSIIIVFRIIFGLFFSENRKSIFILEVLLCFKQ